MISQGLGSAGCAPCLCLFVPFEGSGDGAVMGRVALCFCFRRVERQRQRDESCYTASHLDRHCVGRVTASRDEDTRMLRGVGPNRREREREANGVSYVRVALSFRACESAMRRVSRHVVCVDTSASGRWASRRRARDDAAREWRGVSLSICVAVGLRPRVCAVYLLCYRDTLSFIYANLKLHQ